MLRRFATLLLTVSVTFVGLLAMPHAAACCIVRQAPAHDCCKATTQLRTSDCCRGDQQLSDRTVHRQQAAPQSLPVAFAAPAADVAPRVCAAVVAASLTHGLAPPGSLIAQHTSLLL